MSRKKKPQGLRCRCGVLKPVRSRYGLHKNRKAAVRFGGLRSPYGRHKHAASYMWPWRYYTVCSIRAHCTRNAFINGGINVSENMQRAKSSYKTMWLHMYDSQSNTMQLVVLVNFVILLYSYYNTITLISWILKLHLLSLKILGTNKHGMSIIWLHSKRPWATSYWDIWELARKTVIISCSPSCNSITQELWLVNVCDDILKYKFPTYSTSCTQLSIYCILDYSLVTVR